MLSRLSLSVVSFPPGFPLKTDGWSKQGMSSSLDPLLLGGYGIVHIMQAEILALKTV